MDPLSLTASIIAIVGAGSTLAQTVKKIASLRGAPAVLLALNNEIADLQLALLAIIDVYEGGHTVQESTAASLSSTLLQVRTSIEQLVGLVARVQKPSNGANDGLKLNRVAWLREQSRLNRVNNDMRDCRRKLISLTGLLTSSAIVNLHNSFETRHTRMRAEIYEHLQEIHESIVSKLPQSTLISGSPLPPPQTVYNEKDSPEAIKWTIPYFRHYKCTVDCTCGCHSVRSYRTPQYLDYFLGTVFLGYVGRPRPQGLCDSKQCRKKRTATIFVTYLFPVWFLARTFQLAIRPTASGHLGWTLGLGHVIPFESEIFTFARTGNIKAMKKLFAQRKGSVLDIDAIWRRTPLQIAADYLQIEMCKFLLNEGADPIYEDTLHLNSSDYAWSGVLRSPANKNIGYQMEAVLPAEDFLEKSEMKLIHQTTLGLNLLQLDGLLAGYTLAQLNEVDSLGRTALVWSARRGDVPALSTLLQYGARDTIRDNWNMSALTCAIRGKSFECVALLLEHGSDVNGRHAYSYTPLLQCAYDAGVKEMVDMLLEHGAELEATNDNGDTALTVAILKNSTDVAEHLIRQYGANIHHANKLGVTSIHLAISRNNHQILKLLLELKADYWSITTVGATILHTAAESADSETLRILTQAELWNVQVEARLRGLTASELAKKRADAGPEWYSLFEVLVRGIADDAFETASESTYYDLENSVVIDIEELKV